MKHLCLIAALAVSAPALAQERSTFPNTVIVSGEATVSKAPDIATIRSGVTSQGKSALEASETNNRQMTAVVAALKAANIAERDIQTSRLSIQPMYEPNRNGGTGNRITGFQATNQVTIRIRTISTLAQMLDRIITAGANEVSGLDFSVSDASKALDDARGEAVSDAKRKAEIYAKAAGLKIGRALSIQEDGAAPPAPMMRMRAAAAPQMSVSPGEETLRAAVTVTFELVN